MVIGTLLYQRVYSKFKYLSVFLMCGGIAIFSAAKKGKHDDGDSDGHLETMKQLIGIVFVAFNLSLDGYTNNEQDEIFSKGATSLGLMKSVNLWQVGFLFVYLLLGYVVLGPNCEASKAIYAISNFPEIQRDIFWFCVCASSGQLLIFAVMKQYGSLVWITVSITRKLLTVLFSVIIFKHNVNIYQWAGIAAAGIGMLLEVYVGYAEKKKVFIYILRFFPF
jgi:UDP-galactose transporter B1